jgi:hypothetical protein
MKVFAAWLGACVNEDSSMWLGPADTGFELADGVPVAKSAIEMAVDSRTRMIIKRKLGEAARQVNFFFISI